MKRLQFFLKNSTTWAISFDITHLSSDMSAIKYQNYTFLEEGIKTGLVIRKKC